MDDLVPFSSDGDQARPRFTVVIPTCGRESLRTTLQLLAPGKQSLEVANYNVVVTDDSPAEKARDMVTAEFPWATWTQGPQRGPAANRNHGATLARADWVVFLDDDCEPQPNWLSALRIASLCPGVEVVEGKTICPDPQDHPFSERVENLHGNAFWSCNLALRRDVFAELKGFDEDFTEAGGEDMELAWRLRRQGRVCAFADNAVVTHPSRRIGLRKLWWRTFLMRWMLLYRLKTQQAPALDRGPARVVAFLLWQQLLELGRGTAHLVIRFEPRAWRRRSFCQAWKLITFPIVLPYLMVWEFRFRRLLAQRQHSVT